MRSSVVLITGALTGIGRAAALSFAYEGAHVVVSGRRDKEGQALAAERQELGAEAVFVRADVRHENEVRELVDIRSSHVLVVWTPPSIAPGTEGKPGPATEQTRERSMGHRD
jgi:NAD(P)-dependent dehydrogenase (short-subunit alcohol dehydrogenase family)